MTTKKEYLIQKKLHKSFPKYIPKPISYKNGVMKTKKFGTSLKKWLSTHRFSNRLLSEIIRNVRLILIKIRRRYPGFRHMDLHIGNVLFYKGRIMIIDFGLSKMNAPGVCPCKDLNVFARSLKNYVFKKRRSKTVKGKTEESAASIAKRLTLFKA